MLHKSTLVTGPLNVALLALCPIRTNLVVPSRTSNPWTTIGPAFMSVVTKLSAIPLAPLKQLTYNNARMVTAN